MGAEASAPARGAANDVPPGPRTIPAARRVSERGVRVTTVRRRDSARYWILKQTTFDSSAVIPIPSDWAQIESPTVPGGTVTGQVPQIRP